MNCSPELLEAFLDGELDAAQTAAVQQHLAECPDCSAGYARFRRLKAGVKAAAPYYNAPPGLRRSVGEALVRANTDSSGPPVRAAWWRGVAIAASLLLAVSVLWNVLQLRPRHGFEDMPRSVLADHIRSLLGSGLVEVASSDQHTVKPWFAGKLDFSPPVKDLAAEGFPLVGGRLDYLADRRVAALVYHRRQHVITVFIWPSGSTAAGESSFSLSGYNLLQWTEGPMTFWAVSDVSPADLRTLRSLLR